MGFDTRTWIAEGLVDYVVPGDIGFTDFNAEYEEFVKLARGHDCYIYPQIQVMLGLTHRKPLQNPDQYRATLRNFYAAGADGYSTQNYFDVEAYDLLGVLRDPRKLTEGDRHYVYYPLWGPDRGVPGRHKWDMGYSPQRIVLNRQKFGERGEFRFRMCENLPTDSVINGGEVVSGAVLVCRPGIVPGDELVIDVNGKTIPAEDISYEWYDEELRPPLCRFALSSPPAVYGDNYLGMRLVKSASGTVGDIGMYEVEVIVRAAE